MAARHDVSHHGHTAAPAQECTGDSNQWELEAESQAATECGSECGSEGSTLSVLWEGQPYEEELQTFDENVQLLWEAGASLNDVQDRCEPDLTSETSSGERCDCSEIEIIHYGGWSERHRPMVLSGVPLHDIGYTKPLPRVPQRSPT